MVEVLAINPIIVFALLVVPLAPGGLGVRQVSFASLFLLIGAGFDLGKTVGLLQQAIGYLVSIPGGVLWLLGRGNRAPATDAPSLQQGLSQLRRAWTYRRRLVVSFLEYRCRSALDLLGKS